MTKARCHEAASMHFVDDDNRPPMMSTRRQATGYRHACQHGVPPAVQPQPPDTTCGAAVAYPVVVLTGSEQKHVQQPSYTTVTSS